jgi:hypothetical protein
MNALPGVVPSNLPLLTSPNLTEEGSIDLHLCGTRLSFFASKKKFSSLACCNLVAHPVGF